MSKEFTRELVNLIRRHRVDYRTLINCSTEARKILGIKRPSRSKHLPHILSDLELKRFYQVIDDAQKISHQIMLRLLFYTAIRVSELTRLKIEDVDLGECKIFVDSGKGDKDRYILFPESFRLVLQSHLSQAEAAGCIYLFESNRKTKFTTRHIRRIVSDYAEMAEVRVHPHLLRHQMLTYLTRMGVGDAKIQLISGHSSKASLEVYQHLSLDSVKGDYQDAMRKVGI